AVAIIWTIFQAPLIGLICAMYTKAMSHRLRGGLFQKNAWSRWNGKADFTYRTIPRSEFGVSDTWMSLLVKMSIVCGMTFHQSIHRHKNDLDIQRRNQLHCSKE